MIKPLANVFGCLCMGLVSSCSTVPPQDTTFVVVEAEAPPSSSTASGASDLELARAYQAFVYADTMLKAAEAGVRIKLRSDSGLITVDRSNVDRVKADFSKRRTELLSEIERRRVRTVHSGKFEIETTPGCMEVISAFTFQAIYRRNYPGEEIAEDIQIEAKDTQFKVVQTWTRSGESRKHEHAGIVVGSAVSIADVTLPEIHYVGTVAEDGRLTLTPDVEWARRMVPPIGQAEQRLKSLSNCEITLRRLSD